MQLIKKIDNSENTQRIVHDYVLWKYVIHNNSNYNHEIIISHEWSLIRTDASIFPISGYAVVNV